MEYVLQSLCAGGCDSSEVCILYLGLSCLPKRLKNLEPRNLEPNRSETVLKNCLKKCKRLSIIMREY